MLQESTACNTMAVAVADREAAAPNGSKIRSAADSKRDKQ